MKVEIKGGKFLHALFVVVVVTGVLFGAAGRWDLPGIWAYLAILFGMNGATAAYVLRKSPALAEERFRLGPGDQNPWFRVLILPMMLGHWAIAGMDAGRWQDPGDFPGELQFLGLAGLATGQAIWFWAMNSNPFFSGQVRIQTERGHQLASGGPYRFVRHPGYVGFFLVLLASPLALGSWWSALPVIPALPLLVHRTHVEDSLLRNGLPGYQEYAVRVPYRILPGIW